MARILAMVAGSRQTRSPMSGVQFYAQRFHAGDCREWLPLDSLFQHFHSIYAGSEQCEELLQLQSRQRLAEAEVAPEAECKVALPSSMQVDDIGIAESARVPVRGW